MDEQTINKIMADTSDLPEVKPLTLEEAFAILADNEEGE